MIPKDDAPAGNYNTVIGMEPGTVGTLHTPVQPPWQKDNGQGNEWITPLELFGVQAPGWVTEPKLLEATGGKKHLAQMALHPNYWGQRALASCMNQAVDRVRGGGAQGEVVACTPSGGDLDSHGRPSMALAAAGQL
ncbi:MAG: hypothetical protein KDC39_15765 [Actinobacteria bacterium]|nr:hypothetical protein [Actinomycetota bacterium]